MKTYIKHTIGQKNIYKIRAVQYFIQSLYLGLRDNVECPICGHSFSHFLDFAGTRNVWCPRCKSLPRQRLIYLDLKNNTSFFSSNLKVLHFAPELCLSRVIRKHDNIQYVTADLMTSFIPYLCEKPDIVMSVTDIDFKDSTFDIVLCNHVLEHVRDDGLAMREILRVLCKGGYAIMQVPINYESEVTLEDPSLSPQDRAIQYGFEDHVRFYGLDYKVRLQASGFIVEENFFVKTLDTKRFVLDEREAIFICKKP